MLHWASLSSRAVQVVVSSPELNTARDKYNLVVFPVACDPALLFPSCACTPSSQSPPFYLQVKTGAICGTVAFLD